MAKWHHLPDDPNGGSTGEAFFSTLNNNRFPLADRLARESLQNSRDAVSRDKKLSMEFRFETLKGSAKKLVVEHLNLESLSERKDELGIKKDTCLEHLDDNVPLKLLFVADHNTTGLYGNPRQASSHLRRFLLTLGDRGKQREGVSTGGSYGFGKAVYSAASKIHTIVAYSRFDEKPDGGVNTRLMGCGYYRPHSKKNTDYSGRAIFGIAKKDKEGRPIIDPLSNDSAHDLAKQLGFDVRNEVQSGSTILILDPQVNDVDLVRGIETWWWPALVEQSMDVSVYDETGKKHIPKPRQRPDLTPFIDSFYIATAAAQPVGEHQKRPDFNRVDDVSIGTAGLVLLDADMIEKSIPEEMANTIALIRGPRMVVEYHTIGGLSPYIAGAFVASDDVEIWLKASEPPAHDVWAADSQDLDEYGPIAKKAVKSIHARLKQQGAMFRKSAMPVAAQTQRSLRVFENMFGRMFKSKQPGPAPVPPGESAPIRIEFIEKPVPVALKGAPDKIRFAAKFEVRLKDEFVPKSADLAVDLNCHIVEDEHSAGDPLHVKADVAGPNYTRDNEGRFRFKLGKGAKASFTVESEPYDAMWSVLFAPMVTLEGDQQ